MANISQREARKLRKRVAELEEILVKQHSAYSSEWPRGVHIGTVEWQTNDERSVSVYVARRLGYAVVATANSKNRINLYAVPLPDPPKETP